MSRSRPIVVRIAAAALAVATARLFLSFARGVEPRESALLDWVAAALCGLVAHLGLFLSADADGKPLWYRRATFLLLLPAALLLGAALLGAARRMIAGNPLGTPVALAYLAGSTLYVVQIVAVLRSGLRRPSRATADGQPA